MDDEQNEEPYAMSWPGAVTAIAFFVLVGFVCWICAVK